MGWKRQKPLRGAYSRAEMMCVLLFLPKAHRGFCLEFFNKMKAFQSDSTMALVREISFVSAFFWRRWNIHGVSLRGGTKGTGNSKTAHYTKFEREKVGARFLGSDGSTRRGLLSRRKKRP
jgi:hypothetical protein